MPETTHAEEFLEALTAAKEKLKQENRKKEKTKQGKEKEEIKKPAEISIEKEAPSAEVPAKPAKPLSPEFVPPIYKRSLPELPKAPRYSERWPLQMPKPLARPPEEEAEAPLIAPLPARALKIPAKLLDLGKLNSAVADTTIITIQCDGANIPLKMIRAGKIQETTTVLSEEEIKSIIKAFSDSSSQAVTEPMFKASVAGLTISANISAFAGCKFVINRG